MQLRKLLKTVCADDQTLVCEKYIDLIRVVLLMACCHCKLNVSVR